MSELVVVLAEAVDFDHQDAERRRVAQSAPPFPAQEFLEAAVVRQRCEAVETRQVVQGLPRHIQFVGTLLEIGGRTSKTKRARLDIGPTDTPGRQARPQGRSRAPRKKPSKPILAHECPVVIAHSVDRQWRRRFPSTDQRIWRRRDGAVWLSETRQTVARVIGLRQNAADKPTTAVAARCPRGHRFKGVGPPVRGTKIGRQCPCGSDGSVFRLSGERSAGS